MVARAHKYAALALRPNLPISSIQALNIYAATRWRFRKEDLRLANEYALITGSTAGIGAAIAIEFALEGAQVVVHGRNEERGAAVVEKIVAAGGKAVFIAADLSTNSASEDLVTGAVKAMGQLTILVNNAVAEVVDGADSSIATMNTTSWEATMKVNATVPMELCRAAIGPMRSAGHGSIINISSRQAERPSVGLAAYAASKGALNALTRAIAVEEASNQIRANTISPGFILNDQRDADIADDRRALLEAMHLTRLGQARDVALAAVYLASSESGFVTGINLQLDGGSSNARAASLG